MSATLPSTLPSRLTLQTASLTTMTAQHSQAYNAPVVPCLLDSNSPDALDKLLQQVGLSSDNLLVTPEVTPQVSNANRSMQCRPPLQPWEFQPSEPMRNRRGRPSAPRQKRSVQKSTLAVNGEDIYRDAD